MLGNVTEAVKCAGELPRDSRHRISISSEVSCKKHRLREVTRPPYAPQCRFKRVSDVP